VRKTAYNELEIDEIDEGSAVDNPAQVGARALIFKRADTFSKRLIMTDEVAGHAHVVEDDGREGGVTSYVISAEAEYAHMHDWVRKADGSVGIAAAEGHTHVLVQKRAFSAARRKELADSGAALPDGSFPIVTVEDLKNAIQAIGRASDRGQAIAHIRRRALALGASELLPDSFGKNNPGETGTQEIENMVEQTPAEKQIEAAQKQLADAKAELAKSQAELAVAKSLAELSDAERAIWQAHDEAGRAAFLKLTKEARAEQIRKAQEQNAVVYTSLDGETFRKNDDPRLIALAKRGDADRAAFLAEKLERQREQLSKRAGVELQNMAGDEATKVAVLKALDSIPDQKDRDGAKAFLKAANDSLAEAFRAHGTGVGHDAGAAGAEAKLESMAKAHAEKKNITVAKAWDEVLQTDEGRALYHEVVA